MSYMGAYVLWLEEKGYDRWTDDDTDRVAEYHKENPHMIPKPREREKDEE